MGTSQLVQAAAFGSGELLSLGFRRSTELGAQVLQAAPLQLCNFTALGHKVGPGPPASVGSGSQIADVKAVHPVLPPGLR